MKTIKNQIFEGERALYFSSDLEILNSTFRNGESHLKESKNLIIKDSKFEYKYPLWCSSNVFVENTFFDIMSRSGIWYTNDITIKNSKIVCPKTFRRSSNINIINTDLTNASETLWNCNNIKIENSNIDNADYLCMNSNNIYVNKLNLNGNYFADGGSNIEVHDSILNSKDAFWNTENVTVYNSTIIGEYIGWHSKNLKFVNCHIESDQGFCYIDGLVLENCTFKDTPLAFEYVSNIDATIVSNIESIKNPTSGIIKAKSIGEIIFDDNCKGKNKTKIIVGE